VVLPSLIDVEEIDVLLCPNGNAPPMDLDCPIITYIHDVNAQKGMSSGAHGLYRKFVVPLGIKNSDVVVTVSNFSKREIVKYLPVAPDDTRVVYNGVDEFYLNDKPSEYFDLPDEYLLYVGAMNPRKNVRRLVKAYAEIRDQIPHELVLIGPQNKSVYKKLDVTEFSDSIVTPGFLPNTQLKYAYENADGFVYPSLYEGFGIPPLEAMACGTPVVASNRTSLPEILDGFCSLVDPMDIDKLGESMVDLVSSNHSLEDKKELKNHARKFTWGLAAENLYDVIDEVVDT
jgi:glycosyltransferase involved in cell wall biosynthesis